MLLRDGDGSDSLSETSPNTESSNSDVDAEMNADVDEYECECEDDESDSQNNIIEAVCRLTPSALKDTQVHVPVNENVDFDGRDPLTLEPFGLHTFIFYPKGTTSTVKYNLGSLLQYLCETGNFVDPVTNIKYEKYHCEELQSLAMKAGFGSFDLLKLFHDGMTPEGNIQRRRSSRQNAVSSNYESIGGEMVGSLLNAIENSDMSNESAMNEIEFEVSLQCSQLDGIFTEYKKENLEKAHQFLRASQSFIAGPAKKPTRKTPIFTAVNDFLKTLWSPEDEVALQKYRDDKANVAEGWLSSSPPSITMGPL
jgi:hypothetical protein